MNIYIDESGSFVSAPKTDSWNVVVALAAPESARTKIDRLVRAMKASAGSTGPAEIKLNQLSEPQYLAFLDSLALTDAVLFATATDAGLNSPGRVIEHQRIQVANVRKNVPKMKYQGGREGVELLASQLEGISPQLYMQLLCQVDLLHDVTGRAITYFAQRAPATLREFRWRIDQKNNSRTAYEDAFEKIAPALLQTRSFADPLLRVHGFDYSHFTQYEFADGRIPDYLETEYGMKLEGGINIQKLIRGNLRFQDSKTSHGVQVADLLASGLRRCLRQGFTNCDLVATSLGRLMVQNKRNRPPIGLISIAGSTIASPHTARIVEIMGEVCRPFILRRTSRSTGPRRRKG